MIAYLFMKIIEFENNWQFEIQNNRLNDFENNWLIEVEVNQHLNLKLFNCDVISEITSNLRIID